MSARGSSPPGVDQARSGVRSAADVVHVIPSPALVLDADGRVRDANAPFLGVAGMSLSELVTARGHAGWWDDVPALAAMAGRVAETGTPERLEGAVISADGRALPIRMQAGPLRADGESLVVCVLVDRGAERRLEARLRAAVDGSVDGLMVFTLHLSGPEGDPVDATLADANPRAADMLGLRLGAALGRPLSLLADPESGEALLALFARARAGGRTTEDTRVIDLPGGGRMWARMRATPLGRDEVIVTVRDISGERTLRAVADAALDEVGRPVVASAVVDGSGGRPDDVLVTHVDPHAAIALDLPRDTGDGIRLSRFLDPEALERLVALHREVLAAGAPREVSAYPLEGPGATAGRWTLVPVDDTTLLAARRDDDGPSEGAEVRAVMEAAFDSMLIARLERDGQGTPVDAVVEAVHLTGTGGRRPAAAVRGSRLSRLVDAVSLRDIVADVVEAQRIRGPRENVHVIRLLGEPATGQRYAIRCVPLGGDLFAASWRDLGEDEAAAHRLRRAIEAGLDGFQIIEMVRDEDGRVVDGLVVEANERIATQMGTTRSRYLRTRLSAVSGTGMDQTLSEYEQVLRERRPLERERPFTMPGTGTRWIRYQMLPLDDAVAVLSRDITDRRRAEDELRRMTEQLSFVARHSSETISLHARDGRFQFASDGSRRVWGREPGELLGRGALDFVRHDDRPAVTAAMDRIAAGSDPDGDEEHRLTMRVVRPDGSDAALDTSIRAIRDAGGELEAFLWVSRDAAPRLEAERRAAERLRESAERGAEQAALRRVATTAVAGSSVDSVLATAAREAALLLEADLGMVVRFDAAGAEVVATSGGDVGPPAGAILDVADAPTLATVSRRGTPARVDRHPGWGGLFRSTVATPVRVDGRLWGGLVVATVGERRLDGSAEERLARFVEIIELALAAADARARLASQALTDSLTGLPNHRAFHERLRGEAAQAERHARPMALAVMDIDHFKALNDIHGHQTGDQVLTEVARRLRATARAGETVGRIGGEEFGWILPGTDADGALEAVERARRAVSATPVFGDVVITISGGVTDTLDATSPDEMFRNADGALYWAKASGRNTALRYTPEATRSMTAEERARRLKRNQTLDALRSLARAVDARAADSQAHSERVAHLAQRLAGELGWGADRAALLREAALLHDVGKIGIPDEVLRRPGPLEAGDLAAVRRHPVLGAEIVSEALGAEQRSWVRHHHEHWDGHGYPDRLVRDGIPEGARIIAVAEAWDAMTIARAHPGRLDPDAAMRELWRCSGTQFWPKAVEALTRLRRESD